jgi:hypothetical protein
MCPDQRRRGRRRFRKPPPSLQSIAVGSPTDFQPRQKSKPRNGAGEIFVTAVAEIRRETVSAANSLTHPPEKTPPIRDKIDSS